MAQVVCIGSRGAAVRTRPFLIDEPARLEFNGSQEANFAAAVALEVKPNDEFRSA